MKPGARAARRVRIEARAKLNLGLAVGPRLPDGRHELVTVFQSISLSDTLTAEHRRRGFSLEIRHQDASVPRPGLGSRRSRHRRGPAAVPAGADNLVLRAARTFAQRTGVTGGAHFRLVKRIPAASGLGGGSADAAAALRAMGHLWGLRVGRADLMRLGLALGADVPFALLGGTALGRGVGERLHRLRLAEGFRALVAVPRWRVSTAAGFARVDLTRKGLTQWRQKIRFAERLGRKRVMPGDGPRLGNTFESVLGQRHRDFCSLVARLRAAGLASPRLTGSGSAVFGIFDREVSIRSVVSRFAGTERLYLVRSVGAGHRLLMRR